MIKVTKIITIKKYKNNFAKPNDFYAKKKNVSKRYDKQMSSKSKCFNCGKLVILVKIAIKNLVN